MDTSSWDKARVNWDSAHMLLLQVREQERREQEAKQ
jgi:hypothetical protein